MTLEQKIRADIERRIRSGAWPPGTRIPFEHELSATYGCARATVSKALAPLARDGLIERRRKAGTFVAEPRIDQAAMEIEDLSRRFGADDYRFERLARRQTGAVLVVTGVHHASGRPVALERRRIFLAAVPAAAGVAFDAGPPGGWLLRHVPWSEAEHAISAVPASAREARLLGVAVGAPCLALERTTWRAGQKVTEARFLYPGARYRLTGRFTPGVAAARVRRA